MNRRTATLLAVLLALVAPLLIGCGHPWRTAVQARPNPLVGNRRFAVLPVSYAGLRVGDTAEADYLSEKDGEKWQSWQADKAAMNEMFTERLVQRASDSGIAVVRASGPMDARYFIRPRITWIEPGFFTAVVNKGSEIQMTVQITDPNGLLVDEIMIHRVVQSSGGIIATAISGTVTSGQRLKKAAEDAGVVTGEYLQFRVEGNEE